jgi:hypothetical protein
LRVQWLTAFLDLPRTAEGKAAVDFWLAVTGSTLSARRGESQEFATLVPSQGDAFLRIQEIGGDKAGLHLDLHVEDVRAEAASAVALGAKTVEDLGELIVMRSPGGLDFCLALIGDESIRPNPELWPDGQHSLVDQVCLDIPPAVFEREADFWSALTGWSRRPAGLPEFGYLVRPEDMPLRLLLQRLDDTEPGQRVRAHLDLACDGRAAEVRRHEALGATEVLRTDHWVTLLDPSGQPYCITTRDPITGSVP